MDPAIVAEIKSKLDILAIGERIAIPLAIESGSRAWGFPSLDSDYDCRFIYLRDLRETVALFPQRDVIETPLTPVFDVNGWDLRKAIKLMLKGNAVIVEWVQSPITYRENARFRSTLLALARDVIDRALVLDHYYFLLEATLQRHFSGTVPPRLKKVFYALRPALALRQMRLDRATRFPAMAVQEIMAHCDLPAKLHDDINALIAQKAKTREMGSMAAPDNIMDFIRKEHELVHRELPALGASRVSQAEAVFRELQYEFWGRTG